MDEHTRQFLINITIGKIDLAEDILEDWVDLPPRFRDYLEATLCNLKGYRQQLQNEANMEGVIH